MANNNFLDLEKQYSSYDNSKYIVLPIPFDKTSTWVKGADKGPDALIDASAYVELYDIETNYEAYKAGIYTEKALKKINTPEKMVNISKNSVLKIISDNKVPVVLGGEHSVTIGPAMAVNEFYGDVTFIQFDAHADLRAEYEGSEYNHACVMARIREHSEIIQIGIRSMDASEKSSMNPDKVFFAHEIAKNPEWIKKLEALLKGKVYLTIDLDVFDPSIMPATGTPEPGGMSWYGVLDVIKIISAKCSIVGFDVVELCPKKDLYQSDFLAAKLIYKIINYMEAEK